MWKTVVFILGKVNFLEILQIYLHALCIFFWVEETVFLFKFAKAFVIQKGENHCFKEGCTEIVLAIQAFKELKQNEHRHEENLQRTTYIK